jgi:hypothetical protein
MPCLKAEQELRPLLRALDTGAHVDPSRMTVGEWLGLWLDAVRQEVSPKSHERYSEIVNNNLVPALGALRIAKITNLDIRAPITIGPSAAAVTARQAVYPHALAATYIGFSIPRSNALWMTR